MKYRRLFTLIPLYFCLILALPLEAEPKKEPPPKLPAIREFDTETLAKLGREIYQHDQLAWVATDTLMEKIGQENMAKEGVGGWIVDTTLPKGPLVRFLRKKGADYEAGYDLFFPAGGKPFISVPEDRDLTTWQVSKFHALLTAQKELMNGTHPWCGGNPNYVVLDDPDGSGFLVYFLRAKPSADAIPVGGHYRFTVSADGSKVEQVDQLFASCLTVSRNGVPNDGKIVAVTMSQIVSNTPLETHVFLSLQEKLPFAVITMDGVIWSVDKGQIQKTDVDLAQDGKKSNTKPSKKKK